MKSIYIGAWITLVLAALSVVALLTAFWSVIAAGLAIVIGFHSLKTIHQNSKYLTGMWIAIPSMIIASLIFIISIFLQSVILGFL